MVDLLLATLNEAEQIRYQRIGRNIALAGFILIPIIWGIIKSRKSDNK